MYVCMYVCMYFAQAATAVKKQTQISGLHIFLAVYLFKLYMVCFLLSELQNKEEHQGN